MEEVIERRDLARVTLGKPIPRGAAWVVNSLACTSSLFFHGGKFIFVDEKLVRSVSNVCILVKVNHMKREGEGCVLSLSVGLL